MALKRKKQYEADLEKLHGTMGTLETQMMTIENANVNLEALHVMRAGSAAMKSIHGTMYPFEFNICFTLLFLPLY